MTMQRTPESALLALAERFAHQAEQLAGTYQKTQAFRDIQEAKASVWREAERMARFWADPNK
jgi:hypothetical protein